MKNVLLASLLVFCLVLCSCLSDEEGKQTSSSLNGVQDVIPVEGAAPSILDCPPEDIAEYPVSETIPWVGPSEQLPAGWCVRPLKVSTEKLSFGAKGGVRCMATSGFMYARGKIGSECRYEDKIENGRRQFEKEICSWYTATKIDGRTLHISVSPNETGNERETYVSMSTGICNNAFVITQSAD
ncbi:MAG: hypothetical protein LBB56_08505 [Chitinispirillales bacterium]|jgi:hypothetical protein|nr:hypothetical protein [Chitinispirillales bacterium]